jgi:hypothetical protein
MLIAECKGCSYLHWAIGIGLGVRCTHPEHRIDAKPPMPLISAVTDCQLYKVRKSAQETENPTDEE